MRNRIKSRVFAASLMTSRLTERSKYDPPFRRSDPVHQHDRRNGVPITTAGLPGAYRAVDDVQAGPDLFPEPGRRHRLSVAPTRVRKSRARDPGADFGE